MRHRVADPAGSTGNGASYAALVRVDDGTATTYAVATSHGWQTLVPVAGVWGGLAATFVIGAAAGLYPAARAARLNPTDALRTS